MSINLIYKYFPNWMLSQIKIEELYLLFKNYNNKINLISRKDFHLFYERQSYTHYQFLNLFNSKKVMM